MVWRILINFVLRNGLEAAIKKYGQKRLSAAFSSYAKEIGEIQKILKTSPVSKKIGQAKNLIIQDYTKLSKDIGKLNYLDKAREKYTSSVKNAKNLITQTFIENPEEAFEVAEKKPGAVDGGEFKKLSSSWVESGVYYEETRILDLKTKNGHTVYVYKNVPLFVWNAMKAAVGKNGTGAGSVLWQANILDNNRTNIFARSKKYGKTGIL